MPNPNPFAQAFAGDVGKAATGMAGGSKSKGVPGQSSAPRVGPPKATGPKTPKQAVTATVKSRAKKLGY